MQYYFMKNQAKEKCTSKSQTAALWVEKCAVWKLRSIAPKALANSKIELYSNKKI